MYNIRLAKEEDWPEVNAMCEAFYAFSEYPIPYDTASAREQFLDVLNAGALVVAEQDDVMVGMLGFVVHPYPVNHSVLVGTELLWWVEPTHRGSPIAKELVATSEYIAKHVHGASYFAMSKLRVSHRMIDRFYTKHGYREEETSYLKEI